MISQLRVLYITLKRPANLDPSPNIPPWHLPDCLGRTWLQTSQHPFPDVLCIYSSVVTGRSFLPTQGCKMPIMNHAHAHAVQTSVNYTTTPPSCWTCDVTSPIPRCANGASNYAPFPSRMCDVTFPIPICAWCANLASLATSHSCRKHYAISGCANLASKATPLPARNITSLFPFPDVPVVPIWLQKPCPLPARSITSLGSFH